LNSFEDWASVGANGKSVKASIEKIARANPAQERNLRALAWNQIVSDRPFLPLKRAKLKEQSGIEKHLTGEDISANALRSEMTNKHWLTGITTNEQLRRGESKCVIRIGI
jgi:hypothetical protein